MRSNIEGAILSDNTILNGNRIGMLVQTLGGTFAIPPDAPHVLALDPGGAGREVNLPASPQKGDFFIVINTADAAEVITIEDSASVALVPPLTPTQNETAVVFYTGTAWRGFVAIGV